MQSNSTPRCSSLRRTPEQKLAARIPPQENAKPTLASFGFLSVRLNSGITKRSVYLVVADASIFTRAWLFEARFGWSRFSVILMVSEPADRINLPENEQGRFVQL